MPEFVRITDVSPRDGLQNEPGVIPTEEKVRLVELLCRTGVDEIEVTSFVSPKWVPQLGDAAEVVATVNHWLHQHWTDADLPGVPCLSVLVPNERGLDNAFNAFGTAKVRLEKISLFTAASETFSLRNTNASISQTIDRFGPVMDRISGSCGEPPLVRGYVSCAIACPFEGPIEPQKVSDIARRLVDIGVDEIDLGDTIGAGTSESMRDLLVSLFKTLDAGWIAERKSNREPAITLHLHDTFGRAAECVKVALDVGIRSFDGSVAGLGGCPYASTPGKLAPGNIATELLVRTIHDAGYRTNVDLDKLADAAAYARQIVAKARAGANA